MACQRCIIRGRVQGVFFRASTERESKRLGLTGYAINLRDGAVEVLACGEAAAVEELKAWLREGPPDAEVSTVEFEAAEETPPGRFTVG